MRTMDIILFDLDGTLVDSRADIVRAVNATLRQADHPQQPAAEIMRYIGPAAEDMLRRLMPTLPPRQIKAAADFFEHFFAQHPAAESALYPGVSQVLMRLQPKKLMVVSNRTTALANATLKALAIDHYFRRVIGADDGHCVKPTACPLERVLAPERTDRSRILMVGDMDVDIRAGRHAGVCTCGVTYGFGSREALEAATPDFLINDPRELFAHIS